MFSRYKGSAKQAIFLAREEASNLGSSWIEPEHMLLGTMRFCELELNEVLKLKDLEGAFRADLTATAHLGARVKSEIPLSNQSKRVLAYSAEEAVGLNSSGIGSEHLLLGILREPESGASSFLLAHGITLLSTRQTISMLSRSRAGDNVEAGSSPIGFTSNVKRRYWIATVTHLAPLIILGVGLAKSTVTGRHLVVIGAIWFLVALAWRILGPSSFFWGLGKRNRSLAITISYAFFFLFHLFMFGWLIPLGIGIYRVIVGL
jgi:hypothetical protein